jgi:hypothetical protein
MSLREVLSSVKNSFKFSKPVTVKGAKYDLSVLNMGQEKKVNAYLDGLNQEDSVEYLNELRKSVLAESITAINGEVFGKIVKDINAEGVEVEKDKAIFVKEFLGDLPATLVSELFDAYIDVKEQFDDMLKKEMKYDWFKTPEQREKEIEEERAKKEPEAAAKEPEVKEPAAEKVKEALVEDVKLTKINEVKTPEDIK